MKQYGNDVIFVLPRFFLAFALLLEENAPRRAPSLFSRRLSTL